MFYHLKEVMRPQNQQDLDILWLCYSFQTSVTWGWPIRLETIEFEVELDSFLKTPF
jgi:hypothetical protein